MRTEQEWHDRLLTVRIAERTLVKPPDWDKVPALNNPDALLIALDFEQVEFVSSLFWQACIELSGRLAGRGQHLALLNLSPQQKQVFELVEGSSRLALVEDRQQLEDRLRMIRPAEDPDGGVSRAEKNMLWH